MEAPVSSGPHIAVIGDAMLDEHVTCEVTGLSPEDDLAPKLRMLTRVSTPGGAANVAANLSALGAQVTLLTRLGADREGAALVGDLVQRGVNVLTFSTGGSKTDTIVKTRIMTLRGRHIARLDREQIVALDVDTVERGLGMLRRHEASSCPFSAVLVSDYAKGVVTPQLMDGLRRDYTTPILVDPKQPLAYYGPVTALTPNEREAASTQGHQAQLLIVTRSSQGCDVYFDPAAPERFPARARELGDPAGCGDSFVAALAHQIGAGVSWREAVRTAVAAGSCAFDHPGVRVVTWADIRRELEG